MAWQALPQVTQIGGGFVADENRSGPNVCSLLYHTPPPRDNSKFSAHRRQNLGLAHAFPKTVIPSYAGGSPGMWGIPVTLDVFPTQRAALLRALTQLGQHSLWQRPIKVNQLPSSSDRVRSFARRSSNASVRYSSMHRRRRVQINGTRCFNSSRTLTVRRTYFAVVPFTVPRCCMHLNCTPEGRSSQTDLMTGRCACRSCQGSRIKRAHHVMRSLDSLGGGLPRQALTAPTRPPRA